MQLHREPSCETPPMPSDVPPCPYPSKRPEVRVEQRAHTLPIMTASDAANMIVLPMLKQHKMSGWVDQSGNEQLSEKREEPRHNPVDCQGH